MSDNISFSKKVAEKTDLRPAIIENALVELATIGGIASDNFICVMLDAKSFEKDFEFMEIFEIEQDEDGTIKNVTSIEDVQYWLSELESAGILEFEYIADSEIILVVFNKKYLAERDK